jgi:ComEC/Rec2-related protein
MPNARKVSARLFATQNHDPIRSQASFVRVLSILVLFSIVIAKVYPLPYYLPIPTTLFVVSSLSTALIYIRNKPLARSIILILCPVSIFISSSNLFGDLNLYRNIYDTEVIIIGTVQDDAAYNNYSDYEFNITKINFAEDGEPLKGKIRVRTKQNIAVYRGDRVLVQGKVRPALGPRAASISYASVSLVESNPSQLELLRLRFFASVYTALPEPHASLGIGFIAGVRSSIPKEFQDKLSKVGLTHIIAVSGYNLTILVLAISKLGKKLSKYQQLTISLIVISVFLLATGFSPSIVRASIVCLISLACGFFGRKISPLNLILIAAALTASINPTYIWEDIGWLLSFLAFFGVLVLAPKISSIIFRNRADGAGLIGSVMLESFSAQVMTAPIISHIFGTFSVMSLLANILVIPFVPAVMLLVFIVGLVGMLSTNFAAALALAPRILLTVIVLIIDRLSALSWASVGVRFSQSATLIVYVSILIFTSISSKRSTKDN